MLKNSLPEYNFKIIRDKSSYNVEVIKDFKPDIVGITSLFSSMTECAFNIAYSVKKAFPNIPIVMGGNHASNTAESILKEIPVVDYIIKGEAEYTFLGPPHIPIIRNIGIKPPSKKR